MAERLKILGINGSASQDSSNLTVLKTIAEKGDFDLAIFDDLAELPHFRTELTTDNTPEKVTEFRNHIEHADGIIICTPEYVFSIPSRLKNALEWCVSTTVFTDKSIGLITASASGEKAHEELQLIMKTIQTEFTKDTTLLIQGIKGKVNAEKITDSKTEIEIDRFIKSFTELIKKV